MEDLPSRLVLTSLRARLQSLPQGVADGALFFVVTVVVFTVAGALWGALYPTTEIHVGNDLATEVVPGTEDAGFVAYAWFIALTFFLGVGVSFWSYYFQRRSLGQLFWVFLWVLFGAWWFVFVGSNVVEAMRPERQPVEPGAVVEMVDYVAPWPGILVAPTFAVMIYWIGAVISDPDWFDSRR